MMRAVSYDNGDDLDAYVREAIGAFEEDRWAYFTDQEFEFLGDEALTKTENLLEHLRVHGRPIGEDLVRNQPFIRVFLAHHGARLLLEAAQELTLPGDPSEEDGGKTWRMILDMTNDEKMQADVNDAMQLAVARDYLSDLRAAAARTRDLARLVWVEEPGPRVVQYVRRLSRCYISGFFPECVILCRGVLENAVKQYFEHCGESLPLSGPDGSWMRLALERAEQREWLSAQSRKDAWTVWTRANKAVHEDIHATADAFGTIILTVRVLRELYGSIQ